MITPGTLWQATLRWGFQRLYREFAWAYDSIAWLVSRGYWRRWALSALAELPPTPAGAIVELGCGTGHLQLALALAGRPRLGLDASPQMIGISQARLARAGHAPRLARALAQALPIGDGAAATIVATFPTEYILHPQTLAGIRRALAPNGYLLIVDGAQFNNSGLYEGLVDLAYRLTLQGSVRAQPPGPKGDDWRLNALTQAGLTVSATWQTVGASRVMLLVGSYGPDA
jgi:ubiquinone/menaquinone biosynthesis C-methylase UbiE